MRPRRQLPNVDVQVQVFLRLAEDHSDYAFPLDQEALEHLQERPVVLGIRRTGGREPLRRPHGEPPERVTVSLGTFSGGLDVEVSVEVCQQRGGLQIPWERAIPLDPCGFENAEKPNRRRK